MKRYLLAILFLSFASISYSQETKITKKEVPAAVLNAFKAEYPKARITGVLKENDHGLIFYEIGSKDGKIKRNVVYNPAGVVMEIEQVIPASELTNAVKTAIVKDHPNAKIKAVEKSMQGAAIKYEVILQEKNKKFEVNYAPDGSILPD